MKRTIVVLAVIFLALPALAQHDAQAQPPNKPGSPVVQFTFEWHQQNPSWYSIAIEDGGRATFHAQPAVDPNGGTAPEPYFVEWTATAAVRQRIFSDVEKLHFLQGNFAGKAKVADTGLKTLSYKDLSHDNSTSYNYSDNPLIQDLTRTFQAIEATADIGRQLLHDMRYDKLAVDGDLKALQHDQREGTAIEFGSVQPILQQIANDPGVLHIAQQRAAEILKAASLSAAPTAGGPISGVK